MPSSFKSICTTCCLFFLVNTLHAQQAEVKALNDAFDFMRAYNNGKVDSLPQNAANYNKVAARLDDTFKKFIQLENSQHYEKFRLAYGSTTRKLMRLENTVEIIADSFLVDSVVYFVFSYKLQNQPNYFIKRLPDNKIVFDGNAKVAYIDGMYALEKNRLLLVEQDGDFNSSRKVSVIATEGKQWKQLKAFKGLAFGQVAGQYRKKKFVDKRTYFQLDCDMEISMRLPQDANAVLFNERTKVLSYKQYSENGRFKKIEAKYENGMFIIDDYVVGEGIAADSPAVPN